MEGATLALTLGTKLGTQNPIWAEVISRQGRPLNSDRRLVIGGYGSSREGYLSRGGTPMPFGCWTTFQVLVFEAKQSSCPLPFPHTAASDFEFSVVGLKKVTQNSIPFNVAKNGLVVLGPDGLV